MRVLLQRVREARVEVDGANVGSIDHGLLAFVGIFPADDEARAEWLVDKMLELRIFADDHKPMNRSVRDVGGGVLLVSQFTLAADTSRGRRPSFTGAAAPELARALFERFVELTRARHAPVATGVFGADMQVSLVNDGPVTLLLER